jgi:hypothetical protein
MTAALVYYFTILVFRSSIMFETVSIPIPTDFMYHPGFRHDMQQSVLEIQINLSGSEEGVGNSAGGSGTAEFEECGCLY